MMKIGIIVCLSLLLSCNDTTQKVVHNVDTQLYLGEGSNQPLIVAFGGGDGGNAWTSDRVKTKRDHLINSGYAFLAIGYFGTESTPPILDRISLDAIHEAIVLATKNPKISEDKIALIGVSKGAELALILASHFDDISCVVAMVSSHCAFPAHTLTASTSSWSLNGV